MDNFKFMLSSVFIVAILAASGYWAFSTMESGSSHVDIEKQRQLEQQNEELKKEVSQLKKDISLLESDKEQLIQNEKEAQSAVIPETTPIATTTPTKAVATYKYQSLINDLQKMVNNGVNLDSKSKNTYVGTIQKFFNIYNKTSIKIDNDYGSGMVTLVKNFQKAEGLTVDGGAGSNVFKKMISWLKTQ